MSPSSKIQEFPENIKKLFGNKHTPQGASEVLDLWLKESLDIDLSDVEKIFKSIEGYLTHCDLISGSAYYLRDFAPKEISEYFLSSIKTAVDKVSLRRIQIDNFLLENISD